MADWAAKQRDGKELDSKLYPMHEASVAVGGGIAAGWMNARRDERGKTRRIRSSEGRRPDDAAGGNGVGIAVSTGQARSKVQRQGKDKSAVKGNGFARWKCLVVWSSSRWSMRLNPERHGLKQRAH